MCGSRTMTQVSNEDHETRGCRASHCFSQGIWCEEGKKEKGSAVTFGPGWSGRGEKRQEHSFERDKSLNQPSCSCRSSSLWYLHSHLSLLGVFVPGKNWYVVDLIHICSAFESLLLKGLNSNASAELYPVFQHFQMFSILTTRGRQLKNYYTHYLELCF